MTEERNYIDFGSTVDTLNVDTLNTDNIHVSPITGNSLGVMYDEKACANCKAPGEHEMYAYDSRFSTIVTRFCKDCWVIVYGEGTHIL